MSSNNAFLLAALEATKDTVQELEQQTHCADSAFGTAEVKEFVKSQKSLSVQQVVRQLVQPNALWTEFERMKAALPVMCARLRRAKWNSHDAKMQTQESKVEITDQVATAC